MPTTIRWDELTTEEHAGARIGLRFPWSPDEVTPFVFERTGYPGGEMPTERNEDGEPTAWGATFVNYLLADDGSPWGEVQMAVAAPVELLA